MPYIQGIEGTPTTPAEWEAALKSRVANILEHSPPSGDAITLKDVLSNRVWPFYINWLRKLFGPFSYCAICEYVDECEDRPPAALSVIITTKFEPLAADLCAVFEKNTLLLVPDRLKGNVQVKVGQGTVTKVVDVIDS